MNMIPLPLLTIALCVALLIGPFRAYADIDDIKAAMKQEDYRSAVNELWKLSKEGNYEAKMALGSLLGMLDINDKKIAPIQEAAEEIIDMIEDLAANDDPNALSILGGVHFFGWGVPKDPAKGAQLMRKSAELGHEMAQSNLAMWLLKGEGVPLDVDEAMVWLNKSAKQGHVFAQYKLGELYMFGDKVPKNLRKVRNWFEVAARNGHSKSQRFFGYMNLEGVGGAEDHAVAYEWTLKAAEQGDADGQHVLGRMFLNGWGVPANADQAKKWFEKAAAQGHARAREALSNF